MSTIRKQAITSSILVYIGFFIGAINMYIYTKNGSFTTAQFGLTRIFFDVAQNMFAFGSLGVIPILYKFYPYYKDNLPEKKIDLLSWALVVAVFGFILVLLTGFVLEPLVIRKFSRNSLLFVQYYYWVFPFAFGMLFFSVLEAYAWALQKTVWSNFLKETVLRIFTTVLILLYLFKYINFDTFIKLFSFLYILIFITLLAYLWSIEKLHFTFSISKVTKRFKKKMFVMQSLVFSGIGIQALAQTIDSIFIATLKGLDLAGIFTLAQYAANLIQVPQRSIQSITTGVLSQAWKDKNYKEINRIYKRSSINLLLLALFIFGNVWLNAKDVLTVLKIQEDYQAGIYVILVLGIARIIDAGTGVNGPIIATSTFWRFDFFSGVVLLAFRIPLTYFLIKTYGIIGAAFAEVIAYGVYNSIRWYFLKKKFNMQPFSVQTLYSIVLATVAYFFVYFLLSSITGWIGILLKGFLFSTILTVGIFYWELTPDAMQLFYKWKEKLLKK